VSKLPGAEKAVVVEEPVAAVAGKVKADAVVAVVIPRKPRRL
jgi:hypothetical protein